MTVYWGEGCPARRSMRRARGAERKVSCESFGTSAGSEISGTSETVSVSVPKSSHQSAPLFEEP